MSKPEKETEYRPKDYIEATEEPWYFDHL